MKPTMEVARLDVGDPFPELSTPRVGGGTIALPDDVEDGWAVLLFYRGHWCPYCRQQLQDFQETLDRFTAVDVRVTALSVDAEDDARDTVETHGIEFPVGYGLDPLKARERLGAYLDGEETFVQATGFVLRPGGKVALAVYSSGAVGRLVARDVLGLIAYQRQAG